MVAGSIVIFRRTASAFERRNADRSIAIRFQLGMLPRSHKHRNATNYAIPV